MYTLYFGNRAGRRDFISKFNTLKECEEQIPIDVKERSKGRFNIYYTIYNFDGESVEDALENGKEVCIDVGSHTEFYYIRKE